MKFAFIACGIALATFGTALASGGGSDVGVPRAALTASPSPSPSPSPKPEDAALGITLHLGPSYTSPWLDGLALHCAVVDPSLAFTWAARPVVLVCVR